MEQTDEAETSYVTMQDILKEQEELEETSQAVLGGSDEKNCTYLKGYVGRQALYACLTCVPEARVDETKRSGVCLACALQCHDNHELLELYTKRNFRCDCGGKRMPDVKCKLEPRKEDETNLNKYNQNFSGLYCTCHRPYPDPDDDVADEMIQCIICEDWYHMRHLDLDEPRNEKTYAEMICGKCIEGHSFLKNYVGKIEDTSAVSNSALDDTLQVDVTGLDESASAVAPTTDDAGPSEPKQRRLDVSTSAKEDLPKAKSVESLDICTKPPLEEDSEKSYKKGATFWMIGWRKHLCQCKACCLLYNEHEVMYLLNEKDTVQHYEEIGKQRLGAMCSSYERGMQVLGQLDQLAQVDMLTEYNRMKERLRDHLAQFVTNQQVVTQADITQFFADLKKENRDAKKNAPPYFCR